MSGFSKGQKRIAAYILENYDKAAFMTASRLGILAGVSESTVVRFASELGYDGYPSMQRALQDMIRSRLTSTQRIQAAGDMFQDVLPAVIQSDIDKLRQMLSHSNRSEFDRVVDKIMSCRHVYILGVRSSSFVAGYLHFYMHLLSENVTLIQSNAAGEMFEQMLRMGPGDVLIAISFPRYSKVTINTVKFARDRGAEIIAITDNELSPVYQLSQAALLAPCEMISFVDSMVAPLSLINALLVALSNRYGADVSARGKAVKYHPDNTDEMAILAVSGPVRESEYKKSIPFFYYIPSQPEMIRQIEEAQAVGIDCLVRMKSGFRPEDMERFLQGMGERLTVNNVYVSSVVPLGEMRTEILKKSEDTMKKKSALVSFMLINVFFGIIGTFWLRTQARQGEIGLRMALGSNRSRIGSLMNCEGLMLLVLTVPLVLVFILNMLYFDMLDTIRLPYTWWRFAVTFGGAYLLMAGMISLGIWFPMYKAVRMKPAEALHYE